MLKEEIVQSPAKGEYTKIRKTGIPVIGDAPWGTHFCQFYQTKEDLLDILVPYFKAGLESNEFCMWVTSEPLSGKEAEEAMRRAVPNFDGYVERGQIEIVPYTEWYLKGGAFNLQRVLNGWVEKLNQALAKGYDGMRLTGNTAWLEKRGWKNFVDYEQEINDVIGKYRMIALCTYSLDKCEASEVIDVVRNHQFAVIKREGKWELIESSEIKRAEVSLREAEERYRELTEDISDVFFAMDKDFRYTYWNKASEKLTGILAKDAIGKSLTEVFPDVKGTKIEQVYLETLRTQKPQSCLNKYQLDGKDYVFEINAYPTKTGLSVFAKDITEHKKAEQALRASLERYRSFIEVTGELGWTTNADGEVLEDIPSFRNFTGQTYEEVKGWGWSKALHPDDLERTTRIWKEANRTKSKYEVEYRLRRHDGVYRYFMARGVPVLKEDGSIREWVGTCIDITERKKAEEALRESEERFKAIIENAPFGYYRVGKDGLWQYVNPVWERMHGFSSKEVVGKSFEITQPEGSVKQAKELVKRALSGESLAGEFGRLTKEGKIEYHSYNIQPIKHGKEIVAIEGFIRDISERKKAEKALREAEEKNRKTIENANVGIITYGPEGEVKVLNPKMEEITGFNRTEIPTLAKWFEKLYPNEEERRKVRDKWFKRMSGEGEVNERHAIITTKEGKRRNFLFNAVQLKSGDSIAFAHDITERKQAEEELRETKNYLDNLLNYANAPIIVWDNENKISLFNNAFEALTGYKKESVLGRNIDVLFPPVQKEEILQTIEKATKGEKWQSVEVPILCKGKETRIALWNSANITDKDGTIVATIAQGQDITERKKVEEALRGSEEKWRSLAENAPNIIIIVDRLGTIQFINRTVVDARPEEIVGKSVYDFIGPEHHNVVKKTIEQVFQTGEGGSYEISGVGPKGSVSWYATQVGPVKHDGQIVSATLITTDITERKKAEEKLDESEKKFKSIFEGARDGILAVDAKTKKFVLANPRILELTGYSEKELLRLGVEDIHPEKDLPYVMDAFAKQLQRKIEVGRDMPVLRKDRNVIYCDINSYLLEVRGRKLLVGLFRDVTERKNMEKHLKEYSEHLEEKVEERTIQLKKTQEQLLKAERLAAIGEVANMVGHDLRNPLQVITNTIYTSEKKSESIPITEKEILEKHGFLDLRSGLKEQVEYMEKIVSDLQDYARPVKPMPVEIGLHQLINKTLSSLTVPENVKVSIVVEKDFPKLMLDPTLMQRVFSNLITNAVQAMPNGGKLTIRASKKEETTLISIEDTGAGIPDENLSKLFTPLFTTKAKGQGFGLPVCKRLVEAHDGNITVKSKVGKGSTFTIKIPLRR